MDFKKSNLQQPNKIIVLLFAISLFLSVYAGIAFLRYASGWPPKLLGSLYLAFIYSFPPIVTILFGYRYQIKKGNNKKLFWKMPIYSIVPTLISIILYFVFVVSKLGGSDSMAAGLGLLFALILIPPFAIIVSSITSLFLAFFMFHSFNKKNNFIIISVILFILIMLLILLSVPEYSKCGPNGCNDAESLAQIAIKNQDPSICERAPTGTKPLPDLLPFLNLNDERIWGPREGCYEYYAIKTKNSKICQKADYKGDKCYLEFTKIPVEIEKSECASVNDLRAKSMCYYVIAIKNEDTSVCMKVTYDSPYSESRCISDIAKKTNNLLICEKIKELPNAVDYNYCKWSFNNKN